LARALRYVFLNPVRARIVDDPWTWPWSTLRDLVAAVHPIWTDARTISRRTRIPGRELVTRLTTTADARYEIPHASEQLAMSLLGARSATAAALRVPFDETITDRAARRLVVQLLYASGTPHATTLATELGCTRRTIHNLLQQPHPALSAALLCISDPRLSRLAPGFPIFERSAP
jgi:hypothetical protein